MPLTPPPPGPPVKEHRIALGLRTRLPTRLDNGAPDADSGPDAATVLDQPRPVASALVLTGGEPTLRPDLLGLIRGLAGGPPLVLHTDGLALTEPRAVDALRDAGLARVRIDLHSAPSFAPHDWLLRTRGAGARAVEALRVCRARGLATEVEVVLTRPSTPLLPTTVEAAFALGAGAVRVRRLRAEGAAAAAFVALSPRLGLAQPLLAAAVAVADRYRRPLSTHGFPACAAERVVCEGEGLPGCARCPGLPACEGAPPDYVARFGWSEIRSEDQPPERLPAERVPPPRAGRRPATRVAATRTLTPAPRREPPEALRVRVSPGESGGAVRHRLLQAAEDGAKTLHLVDVTAHAECVELLRDAGRLPFTRLVAYGEGHALPRDLGRVRRWDELRLNLYGTDAATHDAVAGPGAFAATLDGARRVAELTPARVSCTLFVRNPDALLSPHTATLPGEPHLRLVGEGSLRALAALAPALPEGLRAATLAVLPPCLGGHAAPTPPLCEPSRQDPDHPRDPFHHHRPCPTGCAEAARCPGLPLGWTLDPGSPA